jgi:hypothetical protein
VAVVPTLAQIKQIRINIHKRNNTKNTVQTIQNAVNTSPHINKTPTHYKTSLKTQYKIHTKLNWHNTIKYTQYKDTPMYMTLLSPRFTVTHFISFHPK